MQWGLCVSGEICYKLVGEGKGTADLRTVFLHTWCLEHLGSRGPQEKTS